MVLCLEQEVHLARRGCWKTQSPLSGLDYSEFSNGAKQFQEDSKRISNFNQLDCSDFSVTNIVYVNHKENNNISKSDSKVKQTNSSTATKTINQCFSNVADAKNVNIDDDSCCDDDNVDNVMKNQTDIHGFVAPSQFQNNLDNDNNNKKQNNNVVKSVSDVVIKVATFFSFITLFLMSMSYKQPQQQQFQQTKQKTTTTSYLRSTFSSTRNTGVLSITNTTSHRVILFVTVIYLFSTSNCVSARPNLTAVAVSSTLPTQLESVSGDTAASSELQPIAEASLAAPVPTSDKNLEVPPLHEVVKDIGAHDHGAEHKLERFPVFKVDFAYVETPFIIGIWILFASIAKIGKLNCQHDEFRVEQNFFTQIKYN